MSAGLFLEVFSFAEAVGQWCGSAMCSAGYERNISLRFGLTGSEHFSILKFKYTSDFSGGFLIVCFSFGIG